jgi:hypothetical protein
MSWPNWALDARFELTEGQWLDDVPAVVEG